MGGVDVSNSMCTHYAHIPIGHFFCHKNIHFMENSTTEPDDDYRKGLAFLEKHRQRTREYYTKNLARNMAQCLHVNRRGVRCVTQTRVRCIDGVDTDPYCYRHRKR